MKLIIQSILIIFMITFSQSLVQSDFSSDIAFITIAEKDVIQDIQSKISNYQNKIFDNISNMALDSVIMVYGQRQRESYQTVKKHLKDQLLYEATNTSFRRQTGDKKPDNIILAGYSEYLPAHNKEPPKPYEDFNIRYIK